jgi:membrane-associated phospholipid phosphatase
MDRTLWLPHPPARSDQTLAAWLFPFFLLLLLGFCALPHDLALARWLAAGHLPGGIQDVLERSETFAHGIGIAAILIVLFVADPLRRWTFPRVVFAVVAAGLSANLLKLLIGRLRPHSADLSGELAETFSGLLPLFTVGSTERSIPSAHTAAAVAFAVALAWLYPRARSAFFCLAILAAAQRLSGSAHFLSDVFWGAAVGWLIGHGVIAGWLTISRFDAMERRLRAAVRPASEPPKTVRKPSSRRNRAA